MTFSIAARCPETGQFGIAISSSSIAVGARCPWLLPGVGVVFHPKHHPALARPGNPRAHGARPRACRGAGQSPGLRNGYSQYRQITAIDHLGQTAHFSGTQTLGNHNAVSGEQCVAAGNMLADRLV